MKSDVITISDGKGIEAALLETEKVAVYCGLAPKQAIRLRLLAEEMTGMLRTIVGDGTYKYMIETQDGKFILHLSTGVFVDRPLYDELIKASTTGKNAAARGFMGRVRDILLRMREPGGMLLPDEYGYSYLDACGYDPAFMCPADAMCSCWSMNVYREQVEEHKSERPEEWDELEKSIMANLADEVKVFISGDSAELVVEKKFS